MISVGPLPKISRLKMSLREAWGSTDPLALLGQVVSAGRRKSGFSEASLAAEHDVAAIRILIKNFGQ